MPDQRFILSGLEKKKIKHTSGSWPRLYNLLGAPACSCQNRRIQLQILRSFFAIRRYKLREAPEGQLFPRHQDQQLLVQPCEQGCEASQLAEKPVSRANQQSALGLE